MKRLILILLSVFITLSGCASSAENSSMSSRNSEAVISSPTSSLLSSSNSETSKQSSSSIKTSDPSKFLPCKYTIDDLPSLAVSVTPYSFGLEVQTVILPHHLVAASMIASALGGAAQTRKQTDTVVIFAPNHSGMGGDLLTTQKGFSTSAGSLANDTELTGQFLGQAVGAVENDDILTEDHSASALMPFVKTYFPDSKIAVILFSRSASPSQVFSAVETVSEYAKEHQVLLVGSIDFAHGLTPFYANTNDQYTAKMISAGESLSVFLLGNEYLDSPQTAAALMRYTSAKTGSALKQFDHSNALFFLKNIQNWEYNKEETTSYMIFAG